MRWRLLIAIVTASLAWRRERPSPAVVLGRVLQLPACSRFKVFFCHRLSGHGDHSSRQELLSRNRRRCVVEPTRSRVDRGDKGCGTRRRQQVAGDLQGESHYPCCLHGGGDQCRIQRSKGRACVLLGTVLFASAITGRNMREAGI